MTGCRAKARSKRSGASIFALALSLVMTASAAAQTPVPTVSGTAPSAQRRIALTVDDLPAMDAMDMSSAEITQINAKLLAALRDSRAPAIGFVIEGNLYKLGEVDARIAVLSSWLDAGFTLGNHTYSHTSLNEVELRDWEDDVVLGESVTKFLLAPRHGTLRYLRYPFLDSGPDINTKRAAEAFLTARGYRVAPVTIDTRDWFFGDLYADARRRHHDALTSRIVAAWLSYVSAAFTQAEDLSRSLMGYEPPQVLLMHDCQLEAEHLPELIALMRARSYSFVSLDEALTDPAYAQPDDYISDVGTTWLEHWAATHGRPVPPSARPQLPQWTIDAHRLLDAATAGK